MGIYEQAALGEPNATAGPKWLKQFKEMNEKLNSSNKLEDSGLASPNNGTYRTIFQASGGIIDKIVTNRFVLGTGAEVPIASGSTAGLNPVPFFWFAKADYEVAGKTQKLRLRAQIGTNGTKPTLEFTVGLYPLTVSGGAGEFKPLTGTVVSGSAVTFNEPAASTITSEVSADFTIPADGAYALGFETSKITTEKSYQKINAQLQTRSV